MAEKMKTTMKFCPYCGNDLDEGDMFCCMCGKRLYNEPYRDEKAALQERTSTAPMEKAGLVSEDGAYAHNAAQLEQGAGAKKRGKSRLICIFLSAVMLALFFVPWLRFSAGIDGIGGKELPLFKNRGVPIVSLQPFAKETFAAFTKLAGDDPFTEEGKQIIWYANGALLLIEGYFLIVMLHFLLFALLGIFTSGKARYYFARVGSTMMFLGLIVFITLAYTAGAYLGGAGSDPNAALALKIKLAPTLFAFIAAALALLFRTLGIREIRKLDKR